MNYKIEADKVLKNYNILNNAIRNIEEDIEILNEELINLKAVSYDSNVKSSNYFTNERNNNLLYKKSIQENNLKVTKEKIEHVNNVLEEMYKDYPEETEFIRQRYFKRIEMEELADAFLKSLRQIYRLRDKALSRFAISFYGFKAIV